MGDADNLNRPTTVWEAMRAEINFLASKHSAVPLPDKQPEFQTLLDDFLLSEEALRDYAEKHRLEIKRADSDSTKQRSKEVSERKQALHEQVSWARVRVANYVYARSRANKLSAICLSGGGIRSATFSLGVLEGLAQTCSVENGTSTTLLDAFDYLSTVSGGGYIGAWLSSWIYRCSLPVVVRELQHGRGDRIDPDAEPISFLREYSNYLNPKLGFTSADTWALIATVVRNILLNWLVLLPLIASVLILPTLLSTTMFWLQGVHPTYTEPLGLAAELFALFAFCYMCVALPAAEIENPPQAKFLWCGLTPTILASLLFSVYASVQHRVLTDGWQHPRSCGIPILLAFLVVVIYGYWRRRKLDWAWIVGGLLAVLFSALSFGWLTSRAVAALPQTWTPHSMKVFVALSVPALLLLIFAGIAILVGVSSFDTGVFDNLIDDDDREWFARAGGWILIFTFGWLILGGVGLFGGDILVFLYTTIASALSGWVLATLGRNSKTPATKPNVDISKLPHSANLRAWAIRLLLPVFIVLLLISLASANDLLLGLLGPNGWVGKHFGQSKLDPVLAASLLFVIEFGISLLAAYVVNVNKFSLHGMYKLRLIRAYLGASRTDRNPNYFTGFDPDDNLNLKDLKQQRPVHVINMALNLVGGQRLSWQQRKAASFSASPFYSGSFWWGYRPTEHYTDTKNGLTMGGAVTISGAAASPNMGYHSSPLLTIVMTLFNARLGAWIGNTGRGGTATWKENGPTFGWRSYIDELFGLTNEENNWVYLSDGGHFENLGIYEMVLRRCHNIVAVDAGCDKDYTFEDLANAVRKIRIDLGVPIDFPQGVKIGNAENPGYHCAVGRIRYSQIDGSDVKDDGWLLYIKSSLTGDEPADVKQYGRSSPDFPHESTTDQWFSESQFESYRALGNHIVRSIVGESGKATLEQFIQRADGQTRTCGLASMIKSVFG